MAAVKMESPPLTLESLPTDLLLLILSFLDYRDLINCCYVSRRLSQLSSHDPLWRRQCKKYCPISEEEKARKNQCWKSLFFDTYSDVGRYIDHYAAIRKAWDDLKKYLEPRDSQMVLSLKDKMSAKRKSYSVEYKKGIVEDSRGKNLTAFCKEKKLDVRMVRKWRAEYDNLSQQVEEGNAKKRKCGSGRQPLFPELEDIVCEWVADKKAKALVVRRADIQAFALAVAPQLEISPEEFKASQHWLDGFLQRYELSLRSTTLFRET